MVGLDGAAGDHSSRTCFSGGCQVELQLPHLVAAQAEAGEVIALDRDFMSLVTAQQPGANDRCRQVSEREPGNPARQSWKSVGQVITHRSHSIENQFKIGNTSD